MSRRRLSQPDVTEPRRQRSWLRAVVAVSLQIACLLYIGHVLYEQRSELARALDLGWLSIAALVFLMWLSHVQRAYEFTYMLRRLGVHEPFVEGFLLTGAGYLLNHLPFNAGLIMRATVLKRDHDLSYTSYLALVTVNALVNLAVAAVFGLASVFFAGSALPSSTVLVLSLAFAGMLLGAALLIWLPRSWIPKGNHFLARRLTVLADGIALIRGNGGGIALLLAFAFSKVVVIGIRTFICFEALGATVSPLAAATLASMTVVFSLVNLTPGNLGLREIVLAVVSAQLGSSYPIGMAAASIDRVVLLGYTVISGVPGLIALGRRGPLNPKVKA
jgi:uncharacterized membrane protein YbhN (UPF0104 family)